MQIDNWGLPVASLQPLSSRSTLHGPAWDAGAGPCGRLLRQGRDVREPRCRSRTGGGFSSGFWRVSSLPVAAAQMTCCGAHLSQLSSTLTGGSQEGLEPQPASYRESTRPPPPRSSFLTRWPVSQLDPKGTPIIEFVSTSLLAEGYSQAESHFKGRRPLSTCVPSLGGLAQF